jgi:NIMA (never in mitosis gene a)-related kinase
MSLYDLFQAINKGEYQPIEERYSQELRFLIDSMLKVNPVERLEIA